MYQNSKVGRHFQLPSMRLAYCFLGFMLLIVLEHPRIYAVENAHNVNSGNALSSGHEKPSLQFMQKTIDSANIYDETTYLPLVVDVEPENAITLHYFIAQYQDAAVILLWETTVEIDTVGFNFYRSTSLDGEYVQINDELIGAQGNGLAGTSYSFVDTPSGNGPFYYKLEDIDYDNVSTFHGPVLATNELSVSNLNHRLYIPLVLQ